MFKFLALALLVISLSGVAFGQQKVFRAYLAHAPSVMNHAAYIYHPQMVDSRTGIHYDISYRSNLNGICLAFGFDRGANGADYFRDHSYRAVVIDRYGEVVGMDTDVNTFQSISCNTY